MNQILMAAARGARIQWYCAYSETWEDWEDHLPQLCDINDEDRIHPNDEHLRFGPTSTALREHAADRTLPPIQNDLFQKTLLKVDGDLEQADYHQYSLFLLILSEALADEGL